MNKAVVLCIIIGLGGAYCDPDGVIVSGTEYVEKGDAIQLLCVATGSTAPPGDVQWYKDREMIDDENRVGFVITNDVSENKWTITLVKTDTIMSDAGIYECRSPKLVAGNLTVHVLRLGDLVTKDFGKGDDMQLQCTVNQNNVQWYKNGEITDDAQTVYAVTKREAGNDWTSTLTKTNTEASDNGVYECRSSEQVIRRITVHVSQTADEFADAIRPRVNLLLISLVLVFTSRQLLFHLIS